jgi:hypothetical protein
MRTARPQPLLALVVAALAVAPLPARAQDYVREGWYVGGRGVYTQVEFDTQGEADNDFGFNLFAGYRMFKGFASDFEFEYIDAIPVNGKPGPNFDVRTFDLAWMFRLYPLAWAFEPGSGFQRVQPYLTAGPSLQWVQLQRLPGNDRDDGNFAGRLGGGFDVYLTPNIAVTADAKYTIGTGNVEDYPYWSIGWGFVYRFDAKGEGSGGGGGDEDEKEEDE